MKLRELIARTAKRLAAARLHYGHGTDNPRDEAAFLVLRSLKFPFDANLDADVDPKRVDHLLERRIKERIPVAYLLNEAWLHGVPFYVDRRVIIPRSHIAFLLDDLSVAPRRILDLCTGSGCLAILAARAFPNARVGASDVSSAAIEVAAQNVRKHRFEKRIRLIRSDLFGSIRGRYDLIICNPPYVSTPSLRTLPREYRYEPGIALAGGKRGLDYVARIIDESPRFLKPGGLLVCEVGETKPALERAYPRTPFVWPRPQVFMLAPSRKADASRRPPRRVRAT